MAALKTQTTPIQLIKRIQLLNCVNNVDSKLQKRERQNIINARSGDSTHFYKLIKQQRGKLSRFIEELQVDDQIVDGTNTLAN